ncbi:MAG: DUF4032 domain-containing protein [Nocardioidaceae bacterium]
MALRIVATTSPTGLITLPWHLPLEAWAGDFIVALPRGLSRHVVRFVRVEDQIFAVKETPEAIAHREYRLLRDLRRMREPVVEPIGVVTGRETPSGEDLQPALVTRHLRSSVPYREIFSRGVRPDTMLKLLDALVALLTRLHLNGFYWGDCSLSNTLFRPSAGDFSAYLVDAETGEIHPQVSNGQRAFDLDTATGNLFAEILDLQAGGLLDESVDAHDFVDSLQSRYDELWGELTGVEDFTTDEMWRIEQRIARLNDLGFDVDELDIITDWDGATVRIQPRYVEPGHHCRRLRALTGMDVEDNQARRLLNDLRAFAATNELQAEDEGLVAHRWLTQIYEPVTGLLPPELRGTMEPAEFFHEVLEHRWYLSELAGREVDIFETASDYVATILRREDRRRTAPVLSHTTGIDA